MLKRLGVVPTIQQTPVPATLIARATALAEPTTVPVDVSVKTGALMVRVPAGCFEMGSVSDGAEPVHRQCLDQPFWIDQYEVTREQYAACVEAEGCDPIPVNAYSNKDQQPINAVDWWAATRYCSWRAARLPTEAEWEYAARGPSSTVYPWGDDFEPAYAIYVGTDSTLQTWPSVRGQPPESASWVGAYDMSGNVAEWVSSAYSAESDTLPNQFFTYPWRADDGRESTDLEAYDVVRRVIRGGSANNDASVIRLARRQWLEASAPLEEATLFLGIRCAASDEPEAPRG
jgi:formylglycine-generating enzyme required for sulfatase activity